MRRDGQNIDGQATHRHRLEMLMRTMGTQLASRPC